MPTTLFYSSIFAPVHLNKVRETLAKSSSVLEFGEDRPLLSAYKQNYNKAVITTP